MTSAWVWLQIALKLDLLPYGYKFAAAILLNNTCTIEIIKELLTTALTTVYIDFVIDETAAVTVASFWHIAPLLTLMPPQELILV